MIATKMIKLLLGGVLAASSLSISQTALAEVIVINAESPVRYFINHVKAMQEIEDTLHQHHLVGITGFSGIGKSELVRKFVETHKDKYELIIFIDTNTDMTEQYIRAAAEINDRFCSGNNDRCRISEDPHKVVESLKTYLKNRQDWLLVFDNLHINENDKVKEFIEWKQDGNIIICSQDNKYLTQKVMAKILDEANSNKLAEALMLGEPTDNIRKLVKELREYPTNVLAHSAMYLANNKHVNVDEYLNHMKKHDNKVKAFVELIFKKMSRASRDLLCKMALLNSQKVSRGLLELLVDDKEKMRATLDEIARYGVVDQTSPDREHQVYRMHDSIKEAILELEGKSTARSIINGMLTRLDQLMVVNKNERLKFLSADPLYNSNFELLLNNADLYEANMLKILAVREKLLWYYARGIRSPNKYGAMVKWFKDHEQIIMTTNNLDNTSKVGVIVASYLSYVGSYDFYKVGKYYDQVRKYYERAEAIIKNIAGYDEDKSYIYAGHTQNLIACGRLEEAEKKLRLAEQFIPKEPKSFIGINMTLGLHADLAYAKGRYEEALAYSEKEMNADRAMFAAQGRTDQKVNILALEAEYIRYATILNAVGKHQEAYDLMNPLRDAIEKREGNKKMGVQTALARVLTQLARAELGLRKLDSAKINIKQAIDYLLDTPEKRHSFAQLNSLNVWFAEALIAQGYINDALGRYINASDDFGIAQKIYCRVYGLENVRNFKFFVDMTNQAIETAKAIEDVKERDSWVRFFYDQRFRLLRIDKKGHKYST